MADIAPELIEEVEDCIAKIKSFQAAKGRRVSRSIKNYPEPTTTTSNN